MRKDFLLLILGIGLGVLSTKIVQSDFKELKDYMLVGFPIEDKNQAIYHAIETGKLLGDLPEHETARASMPTWRLRADKEGEIWKVILKSQNLLPSYQCTVLFNQSGQITEERQCRWNK